MSTELDLLRQKLSQLQDQKGSNEDQIESLEQQIKRQEDALKGPDDKDGIISSVLTSKPVVYGAGALGLYALYQNRKKKLAKEKEELSDVKTQYKKPEVLEPPEKEPFRFKKG